MVTVKMKRRRDGSWIGEYSGPTMYGPSQSITVQFTDTTSSTGEPRCAMSITWMSSTIQAKYANLGTATLAARNRLSIILGTYRKSKRDNDTGEWSKPTLGVDLSFEEEAPMPGAYNVDTSIEAAELIKQKAPQIREKVYRYIHEQGARGATADEVQAALGLPHQTGAPRVTELARMGRIIRTGDKRKTRHGRNAGVYISDVYNADAEALSADMAQEE